MLSISDGGPDTDGSLPFSIYAVYIRCRTGYRWFPAMFYLCCLYQMEDRVQMVPCHERMKTEPEAFWLGLINKFFIDKHYVLVCTFSFMIC
ncbi:hypothetical protein DPMN_154506 [Dreissena polymorpha]|uniref:Uncharacterized protein n=1 Tax=Dreissena polymorpha TaxID=45954 RepID=A0A9D4FPC8_DREPO|nr:hypothetical protein DPMN_154506 [Dreissena polymorpha]